MSKVSPKRRFGPRPVAVAFTKMAGAGNDFIVVDNRAGKLSGGASLAKRLCDRKDSIGADGLLLLEKSKKADFRMRIFNPDGSQADMCGNGVRCIAKFAVVEKIVKKARFDIETGAGIIGVEIKGGIVRAKLVDPARLERGIRIPVNGHTEELHFINTGVPHAVKIVPSVEECDVDGLGRAVRFHKHFAPKGVNMNFVAFKGAGIDVRTYERGVEGETLACGTGSTAAALVAAALRGLKSPVTVHTRGGENLKIFFSKNGSRFHDVYLEGPVKETFEGRVRL